MVLARGSSDSVENRVRRIERGGDRVLDSGDGVGSRVDDGEAAGGGRVQLQDVEVVELAAEVKHPVAAAHHRVVVQAEGKAYARAEILVVHVPNGVQRLPGCRINCGGWPGGNCNVRMTLFTSCGGLKRS